jgi:hypothetical protein
VRGAVQPSAAAGRDQVRRAVLELIRVFIGYDPKEAVAYHACVQSILDTAEHPERLAFYPVCGEQRDGSNTFIYERFLIPHRCGFRGRAIFMDGDMIVRRDIAELWNHQPYYAGVAVAKHDYKTKHPTKYLGYRNDDYPRKNWSSVMVWDCGYYPNKVLTPEFVASKSGAYLHRLSWLRDDQIAEIPASWNRLVMEQDVQPHDELLHYTIGIPAFQEYADCDHAEEWWKTYRRMIKPLES